MSSYGIFLQGKQLYSSFLGSNKRTFPWKSVAAALEGGKDTQVIYLLVPSGNCLQSPLLQATGEVCTVPEGYAQHSTTQPEGQALLSVQHSTGLDLVTLTMLLTTNSSVCNGLTVRITTLPYPWALCSSPAWCAPLSVRSVTSLWGKTEGQMCGFSRFLFEL